MLAKRQITNYDSNFDTKVFPQEAHDIYVKAHTILMKLVSFPFTFDNIPVKN